MRRLVAAGFSALLLSCNLIAGLPPSPTAPSVGDRAPAFTLPDAGGADRSLDELLATADDGKPGSVLLVFYRGHW